MDALRAELKKVQSAAAVPALDVRIEQCESFISRSQRRLAELDKQRVAEEELLTEVTARLGRLRLEAEQCRAASSATPNVDSELTRLRAQFVELQRAATPVLPRSPSVDGSLSTFTGQCPSIANCQCPGRGTLVELPQLRDAERSGTRRCWHCCSLRQLGRNVGQSFPRCSDGPVQFDVGADQRGRYQEEVRRRAKRLAARNSRNRLRGCRIGEASNPGPPSTRIRPEGSDAVVESLEQALTVVDTSDEEPLVRSVTGRHVVRRVEPEQNSDFLSMESTARHGFSAESVTPPVAQVSSSRAASVVVGLARPESPSLSAIGMSDVANSTAPAHSIPTWVDREDEASSISSKSSCSSDPN